MFDFSVLAAPSYASACLKARALQQVDFMTPWGTPWLELDTCDQVLLILESRRNMRYGRQKDF